MAECLDASKWAADATAEQGRADTDRFVKAAVAFIDRWKQLRPLRAK